MRYRIRQQPPSLDQEYKAIIIICMSKKTTADEADALAGRVKTVAAQHA